MFSSQHVLKEQVLHHSTDIIIQRLNWDQHLDNYCHSSFVDTACCFFTVFHQDYRKTIRPIVMKLGWSMWQGRTYLNMSWIKYKRADTHIIVNCLIKFQVHEPMWFWYLSSIIYEGLQSCFLFSSLEADIKDPNELVLNLWFPYSFIRRYYIMHYQLIYYSREFPSPLSEVTVSQYNTPHSIDSILSFELNPSFLKFRIKLPFWRRNSVTFDYVLFPKKTRCIY